MEPKNGRVAKTDLEIAHAYPQLLSIYFQRGTKMGPWWVLGLNRVRFDITIDQQDRRVSAFPEGLHSS
jgi:hypothetical protein